MTKNLNPLLLEMKIRRAVENGLLSKKAIQKLIDNNMFPTYSQYRSGINSGIENMKKRFKFGERLLTKETSMEKDYLRASFNPSKKVIYVPKGETANPSQLRARYHEAREAAREGLHQRYDFTKTLDQTQSKYLHDLFLKGIISEGEYKYILKHGLNNKNRKMLHLIKKLKKQGIDLDSSIFYKSRYIDPNIGNVTDDFHSMSQNPFMTMTNNLHNPGVMHDELRVRKTLSNAYNLNDWLDNFSEALSKLTAKQDVQWRKKFFNDVNTNVKIREFFYNPNISMEEKKKFLLDNYIKPLIKN